MPALVRRSSRTSGKGWDPSWASIYSGLKASGSEMNFVTAVDTPLLAGDLVRGLGQGGDGCDVRVPRWKGELDPLCAVYCAFFPG